MYGAPRGRTGTCSHKGRDSEMRVGEVPGSTVARERGGGRGEDVVHDVHPKKNIE